MMGRDAEGIRVEQREEGGIMVVEKTARLELVRFTRSRGR
jgi:hypothetical protein